MSYDLSGLLPGDNGIIATAHRMVGAVRWSVQSYELRKRAESLIATCPERAELCEVGAIFKWTLKHFRYVKDPRFLEMFKTPERIDAEISATGMFHGDCDDVSGYLAALLSSIGYKTRFVVIAIPGKGEDYRHVYPQVYLPRASRWFTLEATARFHPMGWEAPSSRRREFPV